MPTQSSVPVAGVLLLVSIVGGFAATIAIGLSKSSHADEATSGEHYRLLGITQSDGYAEATLPGVGRVRAPVFTPKEPRLLAWVQGPPPPARKGAITLSFPGHDFVPVETHQASVPGLICVSIPPYYPDDVHACDLRIWWNNKTIASWHIDTLPPGHRNWPPNSGHIEAQAGPAKIDAMVWREQELDRSTSSEAVGVALRAQMPAPAKDDWEVVLDDVARPVFSPIERKPELGAAPLHLVNGNGLVNAFARMPLKALQPSARVEGHLAQVEQSESAITFRNLRIVPIPSSSDYLAYPGPNASAILPSGTIVKLIPPPADIETEPSNYSGGGLAIFYRIEGKKPPSDTKVQLLDADRQLLMRMPETNCEAILVRYRGGPMTNLPELTLTARMRKETHSFPFSLTVPIVERRTDGWPRTAISGPRGDKRQ